MRKILASRRAMSPPCLLAASAIALFLLPQPNSPRAQSPPRRETPAPWSYGTTWTRWPGAVDQRPVVSRTAPPTPVQPSPGVRLVTTDPEDEADAAAAPLLFGKPEVFRLESERQWRKRVRAEARKIGKETPSFPTDPNLPKQSRPMPSGSPGVVRVEPAYVAYDRLIFEEKNSERYGWDLGPVQPLVSTVDFYGRVIAAPALRLVDPCRSFEANAGYCQPGDPVPYRLYLPVVSGGPRGP